MSITYEFKFLTAENIFLDFVKKKHHVEKSFAIPFTLITYF